RFSHILLLGHDWAIDEALLIGLLERAEQRPRIGCIGSRAKWQAFEKSALKAGISQDMLDSVICPIGVSIGAESPQEIAIAVLAQIISEVKGVEPAGPSWRE
ncbi:MAG: XdhC family protein, partial [Candidatus Thermoplasmatota archaeon]|nr:XdhC family protein [Candidatus Thermoplasmatota archaeon]